MFYATLHQAKDYFRQNNTNINVDDALLTLNLKAATSVIRGFSGWDFLPTKATYAHNYPYKEDLDIGYGYGYPRAREKRLPLLEPLLEIESVFNGDGTEIDLADISLLPTTTTPKSIMFLEDSAGVDWTKDANGKTRQVIPVTGVWGYHDTYERAWVDSLDTVEDAPLLAGASTMLVNDADGIASDFTAVRFQAGQVLKITDGTLYEFVFVRSVDTVNNQLGLTRGYRGTTALDWPQNTPIYIYRVMENVVIATIEICRLEYRRKDFDHLDAKQVLGTGIRVTPETLPLFIQDYLPQPRSFM